MFLNNRPILVLLIFLAASPIDVVTKVLYSDSDIFAADPDGYPDVEHGSIDRLELGFNPLNLLCPVCALVQGLLGGVLGIFGGLLGRGLIKQLGIMLCSTAVGALIKVIVLPNALCALVVELVFMIGKKAGTGLCPILMLCPMPKNKDKKTDKPTKKTISSAEDDYEDRILAIIENPDTANLKPEMEQLYRDLVERLPIESFKMAGVDEHALHITRNFVAALQYHIANRNEYLAAISEKIE